MELRGSVWSTTEEQEEARWRTCRVCEARYDRIHEDRLPHDWHRRRSRLNQPTGQSHGICSSKCYRAWHAHKERERRRALAPAYDVPCSVCGEEFTAKRSDAKYCSTRCRVAEHRRRVYRTTDRSAQGWEIASNEAGYPGKHPCGAVVFTGNTCSGAAVWKLQRWFKARGLVQVSYWCDEHRDAVIRPDDIEVDKLPI